MVVIIVLFWVSLSVLAFCYIGYGLFLFLLNILKGKPVKRPIPYESTDYLPVTIVIAAYNEGPVLQQKITNTLAIDYPAEKLKIILVTDGSGDGSEHSILNQTSVSHLHQPERKGKLAALKRAIQIVDTPIIVFSDANTMLNKDCIKKMMIHYRDPKTGGVAGEKKILNNGGKSAVGNAEGLYWKYESFMKKQDADFNTVVGAAGELFSIRTELFNVPDENIILDDFIISMKVCLQGYKIKYEPSAFATELASASLAEEAKRKIRISAGAYQSIGYLKDCLNFFRYPLLCFQYVSRRLLRWIFCPLMLILFLVTNILITNKAIVPQFYLWLLYTQFIFYGMALIGWVFIRFGKWVGILTIPFYFLFMNYCLIRGFFRFLNGKQSVLWEKSVRQVTK
jgi:poly-beta-1,6-N-acetyl-D-glucosamine synthase